MINKLYLYKYTYIEVLVLYVIFSRDYNWTYISKVWVYGVALAGLFFQCLGLFILGLYLQFCLEYIPCLFMSLNL